MRTFRHNEVIFVRYVLERHLQEYKDVPFGTRYRIVGVNSSCHPNTPSKCKELGCPGKILLDREPFNKEYECYSWHGGASIFDFSDVNI